MVAQLVRGVRPRVAEANNCMNTKTHHRESLPDALRRLALSLLRRCALAWWPAPAGALIAVQAWRPAPAAPDLQRGQLRDGAYRCRGQWGRKCCWP